MFKRIKRTPKAGFRVTLYIEDVEVGMSDYSTVVFDSNGEPEAVLILDPVLDYPDIGMFYRNKISGLSDPKLGKLLNRLKYLNPGIDKEGIKKLTDFVIRNFTKIVKTEDRFSAAVTHEELSPVITALFSSKIKVDMDDIYLTKHVLYMSDSKLSKNDKISISKRARNKVMSRLYGELLHEIANDLVEQADRIRIVTKPQVFAEANNTEKKSDVTWNKHLIDKTKNLLKAAKEQGLSARPELIEKYKIFLQLPKDVSFDKAVEKLKVSKSTIKKFKDYAKDND
jgi:hypothetical protein